MRNILSVCGVLLIVTLISARVEGIPADNRAHTTTQPGIPSTKTLVADETWVVASGTASFRVICCNDSITKRVLTQRFQRVTAARKQDRHGYYWEYSFYFLNSEWITMYRLFGSLN